ARGCDVATKLHVALVAGVFEQMVIRIALPIEARDPGCGEDDRIVVRRFVDDRVRPGHGEALYQLRLVALRRVIAWGRAPGAYVDRRGFRIEVGGRHDQRVAVFPMAAAFAEPVLDLN